MFELENGGDYTITLYELIESGEINIGLDKYSIFDESYRPILNQAIIDTYGTREIGFINPYLFVKKLNAKLDVIMRNKYNDLYKIKQTEFNALYNIELHETFTHNVSNDSVTNSDTVNKNSTSSSQDSTVNSESDLNNKAFVSNYPSEEMLKQDIIDSGFISNMQNNISNGESKDVTNVESSIDSTLNSKNKVDSTGNMVETYTKDTIGSSAGMSFSNALMQFKNYIDKYDLDMQVCNELSDLFMGIY